MNKRQSPAFRAIETALLEMLSENKVSISRTALADASGASARTISYANHKLVESGLWEIVQGGGIAETTYTYLGK